MSTALFLFFYKMVQYLALFKIKQNQSRIDIVFVCAFFMLLFIPMLHINTADTSIRENRMLAKYIPLFQNGKINNDYGKNFETWFNDRFFGRDKIIKQYTKLKKLLNSSNENVLIGKDNWLFYKGDNSIENFRNSFLFSEEQLHKINQYLTDIHNWCKKNNKKFVFFIAPDKNKVYGEFYPDYIKKERPDSESRAQQLLAYLKQNAPITALYPIKELLDQKEPLIYYKHDTHWTNMGGYIGYKEMMKALNIEPIILSENEFNIREKSDLSKMCPEINWTDNTQYITPKFTEKYLCNPTNSFHDRRDKICTNDEKNHSIIFFHDSFSGYLLPYISNSFGNIETRWRYNITQSDLEYIKNNTDIVILEVVERYLPQLTHLSFPKE